MKPPLSLFTLEAAIAKVQALEEVWHTRDPESIALACTEESERYNCTDFCRGHEAIKAFLKRKWAKELDYRLKNKLWCFMDNEISVRFEYEWHDDSDFWHRAYGNGNGQYAQNRVMMRRFDSINRVSIQESERKIRWERLS